MFLKEAMVKLVFTTFAIRYFKPAFVLSVCCTTFFMSTSILAQNLAVSGNVTNDKGVGLEGVTIRVKGTSTISKSDAKGNFTIKASVGQTLQFSSVSYNDYEVIVKDAKSISVNLSVKADEQDEVIVVGFIAQKRPDVSNAVSTVAPKNADKGGYSNFQQILGGRAAGVNVMENNSEPGGGISIEIRGVSSITGSTQPLYVIDGVPIEQPNLNLNASVNISSWYGNNLTANPLSMLNPNDIENIEILKDAAATSLYGSRGANGVVVITTKSGKVGKAKISFNFNQSVNNPQRKVEMLGAQDYANYVNEAWNYRKLLGLALQSTDTPYYAKEIPLLKTYDHQEDLAASAITRDASVSISGGAISGAKYYVSGQYFDQQGIIPGTYLKRYSGKINYEVPLTQKLQLNVNIGVTATDRFGSPTQTLVSRAISWAPTSPLLNPDGGFNRISDFRYGYGDGLFNDPQYGNVYYNARIPVSLIQTVLRNGDAMGNSGSLNPLLFTSARGVRNANTSTQILGMASLTYKFNSKLSLVGKISINQFNSLLQTYVPITIPLVFSNYRGEAASGNSQNNSVLYQLNLNYKTKFGQHHAFNAALVASAEKFVQKYQRLVVGGFVSDIVGYNALQAATPQNISSTYAANQLVSSILQLNYIYKGKLVTNLATRYDGSSKFAPGNQFGFFPSASIAWKIEQEKWFRSIKHIVNEAKLRSSWGLVGNQGIGAYQTQYTLSSNQVVWGNNFSQIGFSPNRLANPYLKWESTSSANVALDLSFFKSKLYITVDAYQKTTRDLLFNVRTPGTSGSSTIQDNIATLRNQGIEITLGGRILNTKNIRWDIQGNVSFNNNKVIKLRTNDENDFYTNGVIGTGGYITRIQPGQSLGRFFGYKAIGIWNDTSILNKPLDFQSAAREGDRRYQDLNGDGKLNDLDRTWLGTAIPTAFGGINTTVSYKNFELSAFFSYALGHQIFNYFEINWGTMTGINNVKKDTYDNRYRYVFPGTDPKIAEEIRKQNLNAKVAVAGSAYEVRESTDFYIENGDYFRCRDISLSYKLPASFVKRLHVESIRIYGNVQNLFIITNYTGFNPEVGGSANGFLRGVDNGSAPLAKAYRFGFTVNL